MTKSQKQNNNKKEPKQTNKQLPPPKKKKEREKKKSNNWFIKSLYKRGSFTVSRSGTDSEEHPYHCTLLTNCEENAEEVLKLSQLIPNDNAVTSFVLHDHFAQRDDASVT